MSTDHNSFGHYPAFLCECANCTLTRELAEQARAERTQAEDIRVRLYQARVGQLTDTEADELEIASERLGRAIVNRAARDLDSVLTDPELEPGSRFTSRAPR